MRLLLDTYILIWSMVDDNRLGRARRAALTDPANDLFVSAVVAYEYAHLQNDGRIPIVEDIDFLASHLGFEVTDLPKDAWREVRELPTIHRDPVDRMQIAHALIGGLVLVTADKAIHKYPVETL